MKRRKTTEVDRWQIVGASKVGATETQTAEALGVSRPTVHLWKERFRETGDVRPRAPHTERIVLTNATKDLLFQLRARHPFLGCRQFSTLMWRDHRISISRETIRNFFHKQGFTWGKTRKKAALTNAHKADRVRFVNDNKERDWNRVFYCDEVTCQLFENGRCLWYRRNEGYYYPAPYHGAKVNCCAGIWQGGKTTLFLYDVNMNSDMFIIFLNTALEPSLPPISAPGHWVVQLDNAKYHTSPAVRKWFSDHNVELLLQPACSPDTNPVETIWAVLKGAVKRNHFPLNKEEMMHALIQEWGRIRRSTISGAISKVHTQIFNMIERTDGENKFRG